MFKKSCSSLLLPVSICFLLGGPVHAQKFIADYTVAREEVIRSIPAEYINKARTELVIAYQHTSHGTHVSRGMFGLQDYKAGDAQLFGISESQDPARLEFRDYALEDYAPSGVTAVDLSVDEEAFIQTSRNYLDAPENATVNVVMWSWCDISGHNVAGNYLPGMSELISEYGPGGSRIGTGEGQRELPVSFIYMTGHANANDNTGTREPRDQSILITEHCTANQQFCLDYYSIDTHAMDDTYYEDAGDDGDSDTYGGNFYEDWQDAHALGEHYFENKETPGGTVAFGEHNTQHITANRKAYAMWWILARIAGWDGGVSSAGPASSRDDFLIYPNPGKGILTIEAPASDVREIRVIDSQGKVLKVETPPGQNVSEYHLDLSGNSAGLYIVRLTTGKRQVYTSTFLIQ